MITKINVIANGVEGTFTFESPKTAAQLLASAVFQRQFDVGANHRLRVNGELSRDNNPLSEGDVLELEPRAAEKG